MASRTIMLCATDAGGVRNIVPLIKVIDSRGFTSTMVTSQDMAKSFNLGDISVVKSNDTDRESMEKLLSDTKPSAIICGTTRYISAERHLISAAGKAGIGSVAVMDEWFNYRVRFEDETGKLAYLPDAVAVMDELARKEAIDEGIPPELCHVTGSPSLSSLVSQSRKFRDEPPAIPNFLHPDSPRPIITFISETHAADYGSKPGESGPMGPYLGYTESSVREDILKVLGDMCQPCTFVEKLHPSAPEEESIKTPGGGINWIKEKGTDLWALLWHSDAVIGMRSMALLEASILGQSVASYQPRLVGMDYCSAVRLGLVPKISNPSELEQWLRRQLVDSDEKPSTTLRDFTFAPEDAAERVVELALAV